MQQNTGESMSNFPFLHSEHEHEVGIS